MPGWCCGAAIRTFYKTDIPHETTLITWHRLLAPDEPMHVALAESAGTVVGLCTSSSTGAAGPPATTCICRTCSCGRALRGLGVGRALIEHVYADAAARGCSRVWWLTHETNTDAMVLYDRIAGRSGFLQYRKILLRVHAGVIAPQPPAASR